jgi:hypothetical protein
VIVHAMTPQGRTFGAWIYDLGSLEAAQALLDAAGITHDGTSRHGRGVTAEILKDSRGSINISIMAGDEPICLATGLGGYLHPGDRPDV